MKSAGRTAGVFLAILAVLIGLTKIYETIVQTFVPDYSKAFHQYSLDLHFGLLLVAIGLTAIWRLRH